MTEPDRALSPRFLSQWAVITEAAENVNIALDYEFAPDAPAERWVPNYFFESDTLLVARDLAPLVVRNTNNGRIVDDRTIPGSRAIPPVEVVKIEGERVPDAVRRLREMPEVRSTEVRSRRVTVSPNHLISIAQGSVTICPASEPVPAAQSPNPPQRGDHGGLGVRVHVVDTGVWEGFQPEAYPWFAKVPAPSATASRAVVTGDTEIADVFLTPSKADPLGKDGIREYMGHGAFVAGVLRCVAPGVNVWVSNALTFAGARLEDQLGRDLVAGLQVAVEKRPHIINLSAGGTAFQDEQFLGLLAFLDELEAPDCTTLVVAAAGNDGSTHKFFPAAFSNHHTGAILSVGALREDRHGRACFSNHGSWVDVFAPGERLVNAFPSGKYQYIDPKPVTPTGEPACHNFPAYRHRYDCTCLDAPADHSQVMFEGYAEWSGTSFAAPYVAGLIARRMQERDEWNPRKVAGDLLRGAESIRDMTDDDGTYIRVLP